MQTKNFQYWWKWTLNCGIGELLGIGAAAALAVWTHQTLGAPQTIEENMLYLAIMVFAGVIQEFILGTIQWKVLRLNFPKISCFQWVGVTILVAMLGWLFGTTSSMTFSVVVAEVPMQTELFPPLWLSILVPIAMGLFLGVLFGYFQWLVLKEYADYTNSWIVANALGWGGAMLIVFYFASLPNPTTPTPSVLLMGIIAGSLAGLSVGGITGIALTRIVKLNHSS